MSWDYENLFRDMKCNIRSKQYKLDNYRIQESPFKQEKLKLKLRIVKPLSQRNGDRKNNKLGDFILLQIIEIQNDSNSQQFNPNNLQFERNQYDEEKEQNQMIDLVSVKQEEVVNLDEDKQLKNEDKKIYNSSILNTSKGITKNKNGSYPNDVDSHICTQTQTINQDQQQKIQKIYNADDKYNSSHNLSNQELCSNYDTSNIQQSSTKNEFNIKQESDEEQNIYEFLKKEDLIQLLKEKDALDKLKWIQEGIEKAQNFRKDLRNQNN